MKFCYNQTMRTNIEKGRQGESLAIEYIKKLGYKIVEKNWHYSRNAEIDIIAEDKDTLVFIEVKTRTNLNYGHPFEAIDKTKLDKIQTAILGYLSNLTKKYKATRIDGIAIIGLNNPKIEHLKDIGQY